MHTIFITDGLSLGKRAAGESNTSVCILTRDMGLVWASARSSRVMQSKLRYGLEPLTGGRFSFVRGKQGWRLVGVYGARRALSAFLPARAASGRIGKLLSRLIRGEELSPALYGAISEGFALLCEATEREAAESIECVLVLRVLHLLGYLPKTPELAAFMNDDALSLAMAAEAAARRSALVKAINESLQATGL